MGERLKHTQTQALLEAVREKMGGATDYKIAKDLCIPRQRISEYHKGEWQADAYACSRFAEVLGRDPMEVIAQVEAEAARSETQRNYWAGFPSGLKRTALGVALSAIWGFSGVGWPTGAEASSASHNVYYVK